MYRPREYIVRFTDGEIQIYTPQYQLVQTGLKSECGTHYELGCGQGGTFAIFADMRAVWSFNTHGLPTVTSYIGNLSVLPTDKETEKLMDNEEYVCPASEIRICQRP